MTAGKQNSRSLSSTRHPLHHLVYFSFMLSVSVCLLLFVWNLQQYISTPVSDMLYRCSPVRRTVGKSLTLTLFHTNLTSITVYSKPQQTAKIQKHKRFVESIYHSGIFSHDEETSKVKMSGKLLSFVWENLSSTLQLKFLYLFSHCIVSSFLCSVKFNWILFIYFNSIFTIWFLFYFYSTLLYLNNMYDHKKCILLNVVLYTCVCVYVIKFLFYF